MGKGRRVPIQLQQQDEEEYDDWEEAEDEDTLGERVTINTKFLGTVLSGIGATNRRKVDTNAAAASTLAMGSQGAASMKLLLQRAVPKGPSAVRRIALSAATKQRLTLCTALLAEVAQSFGFRLSILQPDGKATSSEQAIAASAAMQGDLEGGADAPQEAGGSGDASMHAANGSAPSIGLRSLPLEQLNVALALDNSVSSRIVVKSAPSPMAGARPRLTLALANRLSAKALGSIGLTKKPTLSAATLAARRRLASAAAPLAGAGLSASVPQKQERKEAAGPSSAHTGEDDTTPATHGTTLAAAVALNSNLPSSAASHGPVPSAAEGASASQTGKPKLVFSPVAAEAVDAVAGPGPSSAGYLTPITLSSSAAQGGSQSAPAGSGVVAGKQRIPISKRLGGGVAQLLSPSPAVIASASQGHTMHSAGVVAGSQAQAQGAGQATPQLLRPVQSAAFGHAEGEDADQGADATLEPMLEDEPPQHGSVAHGSQAGVTTAVAGGGADETGPSPASTGAAPGRTRPVGASGGPKRPGLFGAALGAALGSAGGGKRQRG